MQEVNTVGLDLAKSVFQVHGANSAGVVLFRKKLSRDQLLEFFSMLPPCLVAMEACGSAHYWAREIATLGHDTRLITTTYVKPFVKRHKNDVADAEAICEAAQRPTMRFVQGKTAEAQASGMAFKLRDLLVRQQTQLINALRGHLMEFGYVVQRGAKNVGTVLKLVDDRASKIPVAARSILRVLTQNLKALQVRIARLNREIVSRAKSDPIAKRLMTIPGVGQLPQPRWWHWLRRQASLAAVEALQLGSALFRGSTQVVVDSDWATSRRWVIETCGSY